MRYRRSIRTATAVRERRSVDTPVVVDASIAVQWFSNEPRSSLAARRIEEQTPLLAPDLMPVEAVNAWWKKVRVGDMEAAHLDEALVNLLGLGIELAPATWLLAPARALRSRSTIPFTIASTSSWRRTGVPGLPRTTGIYGAPPVGSRSRCGRPDEPNSPRAVAAD